MLRIPLLLALLFAASMNAQISSFPTPNYFRETFAKPQTTVELSPPVQLADYVVQGPDGKRLELGLRSYLELVMANNTDIGIQRLTLETSKNAITRAFSAFDPFASARWTSTRQRYPVTTVLDSVGTTSNVTLATMQQPASFGYNQTFQSGAFLNATFLGQKSVTSSSNALFNPLITSTLGVSVTQPLLRNRGYFVNRIPIMVARSRLRQNEYVLRNNLMQLVQSAENAYWDVVLARDNLRVAEEALRLSNEALKRAQQELDLGAMSPLDIYNPQQQQATAEILVSQSRFALKQREDALKKQIAADLNPDIRDLPITLTETVEMAIDPPVPEAEDLIEKALANRPDLKAANQSLDVDDLSIKSATNALRPDISILGSYSAYGSGGNFLNTSAGFADSLSQMFSVGFPTYGFGVQVRLPIRNHLAAADYADAIVQKKADALTVRNTQQQIRLDILNAINQVEAAKDSLKLAKVARDFAHKYLEAEQKKYELGTSQIYFVLQAQNALINADSTVVQNTVAYRRNLLNLVSRTGTLLEDRGIAIQ